MSGQKKCSIYDVPYVSLEMLRRHGPCGGLDCPANTSDDSADEAHKGFEPTASEVEVAELRRRITVMQKIVDLASQLNCCAGEDAERTPEMQEALEAYAALDAVR